jgi:membrane protease YdiL (CAAX protease family)
MLMLWLSPLRATLLASALFGLWHVLPAISALDTSALDVADSDAIEAGAVAGQVLVTTLAGIGFSWLRFRGRHILAPALAHWAVDGAALVAGWLVFRNGWA